MTKTALFLLVTLALAACGSRAPEESTTTTTSTTSTTTGGGSDTAPESSTGGTAMTPDDCTARGGQVIGDPGDGSTHTPDYLCPDGQPPIGSVSSGIEGAVCCGS
jgi:hypothetical protein